MHGHLYFFSDGFLPPPPKKKPQFYHSLGGTNGNHTIHTQILTHETYNEGAYNTTFRTFITDKIMLFIKASFTLIFIITQGKLYIQELPSLGVKIIIIFFTLIAKWSDALGTWPLLPVPHLLFSAHLGSLLALPADIYLLECWDNYPWCNATMARLAPTKAKKAWFLLLS